MNQGAVTYLVKVEGRVQGVWFRSWTVEEARARNLNGWVRNRRDGSVETLLSGDASRVDSMLAACRTGPPRARVDRVSKIPADPPADPGFNELPTC